MEEWWQALTITEKGLWISGIFATVLFGLQTITTFLGFGEMDADDGDVPDADFDGDGDDGGVAGYFTLRNMIAFLLGFSWGTLMFLNWGIWKFFAFSGGAFIGLSLVALVILMMRGLANLESRGNIKLENSLGAEGTVSIGIPAEKGGYGKVQVTFQQHNLELEAVTDGPGLERGTRIRVIDYIGSQLVVENINE